MIKARKVDTTGFKTELNHLTTYLRKNRWWLLLFNALLILVWSSWIFNTNPRIDTASVINTPKTTLGWLIIGRQGLVLTRHVLGVRWFNPFFSGVFGYLFICISGTLMGYLLWRAGRQKPVLCAAFGLICFTSPIMAEQFYFDLQLLEISWAYILCAVAVALSYYGILKKKLVSCIFSILCMIWIFSSYQVFAVVYIAMTAACFIMLYRRRVSENSRIEHKYYSLIFSLIGLFVIAFVVNSFITRKFFIRSEYLDSQMLWGKATHVKCLNNIKNHIFKGLGGGNAFSTVFFGVFSIAAVACGFIDIIRFHKTKAKLLYFLAVLLLQLSPFLLTMYLGSAPTVRSQLVYPITIACNAVYVISCISKQRIIKIISSLLVLSLIWTQSQTTLRLIYTDEIRAQEDIRVAGQIQQRINELDSPSKPIVFVGSYDNELNASCLRGDMIGFSMFNWDQTIPPHYYYSTLRTQGLSRVLGITWENPTPEQVPEARKFALNMPAWPSPGSVADAGDFIVVKFSEDEWEYELLETTPQ